MRVEAAHYHVVESPVFLAICPIHWSVENSFWSGRNCLTTTGKKSWNGFGYGKMGEEMMTKMTI